MDKPWRPGDAYVKAYKACEPVEGEGCEGTIHLVLGRAMYWAPYLLVLSVAMLLMSACAPHVVKRCVVAGNGEVICECRAATTGRYARCP